MVEVRTCYLAGPMRGYDQFNFPAFHAAAADLREKGWKVLSPAEHDEDEGFDASLNSLEGFSLTNAMRWDIDAILHADAVVVLPGWQASTGVGIEVTVAKAIGVPVLDYETLQPAQEESICHEADRLVNTDRQGVYGHPFDDFSRTAGMWSGYLGVPIKAEDVPLMMIMVKASRLRNSPDHRDSWVDIAGYGKTGDLVRQRRILLEAGVA